MRQTAGRAGPLAGVLTGTLLLSGCVGLASEQDRDLARQRWDAVPQEVLAALQAGEPDEQVQGAALETVRVTAPLRLPGLQAEGRPGVLGDEVAARCRAVVAALQPTAWRAAGDLALRDGPVLASDESCDRGLAHDGLSGTAVPPGGAGVLDVVAADGGAPVARLRLLGEEPELEVSSDDLPARPRPARLDVAAYDAALSAALAPPPLLAEPRERTHLLGADAGSALTVTAQCGTPTPDRSIRISPASPAEQAGEAVVSVAFVGSAGPDPSGQPVPPGCEDGPVTAPLPPVLRYTPTAGPFRGRALDVFALQVSSVLAQPAPADRVRVQAAR